MEKYGKKILLGQSDLFRLKEMAQLTCLIIDKTTIFFKKTGPFVNFLLKKVLIYEFDGWKKGLNKELKGFLMCFRGRRHEFVYNCCKIGQKLISFFIMIFLISFFSSHFLFSHFHFSFLFSLCHLLIFTIYVYVVVQYIYICMQLSITIILKFKWKEMEMHLKWLWIR